jgi:hypothetical protein
MNAMKQFFALFVVLICTQDLFAQYSSKRQQLANHNQTINQLLSANGAGNKAAMKTTALVLTQRVIAQSTRDNTLSSLADSVKVRYTGKHGSTYDYNTMIYPYNYPYGTTPMFNYAGTFTQPQVLYDTYVHWTINPFTMPSFMLYEGAFATYDTSNNLTAYKKLFVDSVTNDNVSYVNVFDTMNRIGTGYTFNLNAGVADSAFKQYFVYDTANRLMRDSVYELHLGVWRIAAKSIYTYNTTGNLVQIDHYANETDTSFLLPLIQQSKYINAYDASNRLTSVYTHLYDGTTLSPYVKDTFAYSGTLTYHNSWKQYQFDEIHGTWWPQYYMSKHITAGKPDTVYHKGWDSIANAWVPIAKDLVKYDTFNFPDTILKYQYNWTAYSLTPDYTTVYYYDTLTITVPDQAITLQQEKLKLYPNPATNTIRIIFPDGNNNNKQLSLSLFNINGQLLSRQSMRSKTEIELTVDYLAPGIYWVVLTDQTDGISYRQQFVKR